MDRSEDVNFNKKFYRDGRRAFEKGRSLQSNPWPSGTMAYKSWAAGWGDRNAEDRDAANVDSDRQEKRNG